MNKHYKQKGQIMLISIMILGGVMIGATAIGGFLLRSQIAQVNNAAESTKALFAADAGVEAVAWCFFEKAEETPACDAPSKVADSFCPKDNKPAVTFDDEGITLETTCDWNKENGIITITARGHKAGTTRILELQIIQKKP